MLKTMLARLVALCVIAAPITAQIPGTTIGILGEKQADPAQMAALTANSRRTMRPASFVLGHKDDLALTPEQMQRLDLLAHGEEDSAAVRQLRLSASMTRIMTKREAAGIAPQTGWTGPVNEQQLRDELCEQSTLTVQSMLDLMRDRQVVATILTGTQIDRIKQLEMDDIIRALKPKQP